MPGFSVLVTREILLVADTPEAAKAQAAKQAEAGAVIGPVRPALLLWDGRIFAHPEGAPKWQRISDAPGEWWINGPLALLLSAPPDKALMDPSSMLWQRVAEMIPPLTLPVILTDRIGSRGNRVVRCGDQDVWIDPAFWPLLTSPDCMLVGADPSSPILVQQDGEPRAFVMPRVPDPPEVSRG